MFFIFILLIINCLSRILDISKYGAKPNDNSIDTVIQNAKVISQALQTAMAGDTILISNETYWSTGGIYAQNLVGITIQIEGTLRAFANDTIWPLQKTKYDPFIEIDGGRNVTITSFGIGVINGEGKYWWDRDILNLLNGNKRPCLIVINDITDLHVENIHMINSPRFHLDISNATNVEIRHTEVLVQRSLSRPYRGENVIWNPTLQTDIKDMILQPEDLNTDGFDLSGKNMYVHNCRIENDDDSIAIKPCNSGSCASKCTQDILIENTTLIGFGASIGSVPPNEDEHCVKNITFRNIDMPDTGKGIYIKSNPTCIGMTKTAVIEDILYENVNIENARWWAIWVGPQQQHEPHSPLENKCALAYPLEKSCPTQGCVTFNNITFRNIKIKKPLLSPGVIKGNSTNPMTNLVFDNVVVDKGSFPETLFPWGDSYECEYANIISLGGTSPKPKC